MNKISLFCLALWGALIGSAHAAGEAAVFKNTAVAQFNDEDLALMKSRVFQALKAEVDGTKLDWNNDKTKASGSVTALSRLNWNGLACRRLRIVNAHNNESQQGVYKFCEQPAGRWKLVGPDKDPG